MFVVLFLLMPVNSNLYSPVPLPEKHQREGSVGLQAVLSYMPPSLWGWGGKIKGRQLPCGLQQEESQAAEECRWAWVEHFEMFSQSQLVNMGHFRYVGRLL